MDVIFQENMFPYLETQPKPGVSIQPLPTVTPSIIVTDDLISVPTQDITATISETTTPPDIFVTCFG